MVLSVLMVVFGAGASFDSSDYQGHPDGKPPLAQELFGVRPLFSRIAARYPACPPLVDELRQAAARQPPLLIEGVLRDLQERATDDPEMRRQLVALRFYLREVIAEHTTSWLAAVGGITNYVTLLREIGRWRNAHKEQVVLVTFNYDEMIEAALYGQLAISRGGGETPVWYVERDDWKLCKLHGSTNWIRLVPHHSRGVDERNNDVTIQMADQLDLASGDVVAGVAGTSFTLGRVAVPALAVPTDGKSTFETHPSHVAAFEAAIPDVTRLLIIGWRASEQHTLEMLAGIRIRYRLGIVSGDGRGVEETMHNLGIVAEKAHPEHFVVDTGFTSFVRGVGIPDFLGLPE
jgi:hypothetical protein